MYCRVCRVCRGCIVISQRLENVPRESGVCDLPRVRVIDVGAMFLSEAEEI